MEYNFDLSMDLSQKILMTPQLKFALEILKMNTQELLECIEEQLESNPLLEVVENGNSSDSIEAGRPVEYEEDEDNDENLNWDYSNTYQKGKVESNTDLISFAVDKETFSQSLKQYLLFQLHTSGLDKIKMKIGEYIIDNINDNGYLTMDSRDIACHFKIHNEKVEEVKKHIQTFDPPGICAANLKECLLIQLRQMDCTDNAVFNLVENFLDDLASNKISAIAKRTGMDIQEIVRKLEYIKSLEPKPGRAFSGNREIGYITPDVIVRERYGNMEVWINEDRLPSLGINEYSKVLISKENLDAKEYSYYHNEVKNAEWFIKCIEQRKSTLLKVAQEIVVRQTDFLSSGRTDIKPLTLKEIAKELNIHESTVSRAISEKYLQCSKGVFELKYFFSGKINEDEGEGISSKSVKQKIEEIIEAEEKTNPLNDSQIADLLNKQGIRISRRTVAKYRGELDIPTLDKRKKW